MNNMETPTLVEQEEVLILMIIHLLKNPTRRKLALGSEGTLSRLQSRGLISILAASGSPTASRCYPHATLELTAQGLDRLERLDCRTFGREGDSRIQPWDRNLARWLKRQTVVPC